MRIENALRALDHTEDPEAVAKLRLVVAKAQEFSKAWAIWSVDASLTPDCDVIESACALMEEMGIKQPDTD